MDDIIERLKNVQGLVDVRIIEWMHILEIEKLESKGNIGVRECLKRRNVSVIVHNSKFRTPSETLVKSDKSEIIFPALPFPELGKNAISASPSKKTHEFLIKEYQFQDNVELATLLIGLD